ncbi:MAG: hypothetical protein PHN42_02580 [Bacilli bacterium]|nr:hypothetical protein [Bacilli bacterium]
MKEIDMLNSIYHGILNETFDNNIQKIQLNRLRDIINVGYIIRENSSLRTYCKHYKKSYDSWNNENEISLAYNPGSSLFTKFMPESIKAPSYGFELAMSSFAFVLDKEIMNDHNIYLSKGKLKYEIISTSDIDIKKYSLGICNSGADIKTELLEYKYYLQYKLGIISLDDFLKKMLLFRHKIEDTLEEYFNYFMIFNKYGLLSSQILHNQLLTIDKSYFIKSIDNYELILETLKEEKKEIPIIDSEGTIVKSLIEQYEKIELIKKLSIEAFGSYEIDKNNIVKMI